MIKLTRNMRIAIKQPGPAFSQPFWLVVGVVVLLLCSSELQAQDKLSLHDLSAFADPGKNWKIAGQVTASLDETNTIIMSKGTGILVNDPGKEHGGKDLYTNIEHGDIDLELDYMMPRGANSGIYLQGRYELQLLDSWSVKDPTSGDNGGIYERWDPGRPEGQKGYQGYAPRQNASRAPGLWQHLKISFQAPRFDENGQKVKNARMLSVTLNGVTIHDDVELMGPTRGAIGEGEVARGPLRIQGDHGAVAFRNIKMTRYDTPAPTVKDLTYKVFEGTFEGLPDPDTLSLYDQGSSDILTAHLGPLPQQFLLHYSGILHIKEKGEYHFGLATTGNQGSLRINDSEVIPLQGKNQGTVNLSEGEIPVEVIYIKRAEQTDLGLGLTISAPGLRKQWISDAIMGHQNMINPIYVTAREKPLLRSFRDLPDGTRLTHAVSASSLDNVHYTYDLNRGNLIQIWRGNFLNVTPMWHRRGDGSSRPAGSVETLLDIPSLFVNYLENRQTPWSSDTTGSGYHSNGYAMDEQKNPVFRYTIHGTRVQDQIRITGGGEGLQRTVTLEQPADQLYFRLASAGSIRKLENNRYVVGDSDYYIRIDDSSGRQPFLRTSGDRQELLLPARKTLTYSILF